MYIYFVQTSLDEQLSMIHLAGAEMDTFDVKLIKDDLGLGITIAGYFRDKTMTTGG